MTGWRSVSHQFGNYDTPAPPPDGQHDSEAENNPNLPPPTRQNTPERWRDKTHTPFRADFPPLLPPHSTNPTVTPYLTGNPHRVLPNVHRLNHELSEIGWFPLLGMLSPTPPKLHLTVSFPPFSQEMLFSSTHTLPPQNPHTTPPWFPVGHPPPSKSHITTSTAGDCGINP